MIKFIKNLEIVILVVVVLGIFGAPFAGFHPYGVVSGSMEPEIPVGSLVYADSNVEMSEITKNDVIMYDTEEKTIVHRVLENTGDAFITKGDANDVADPEPVLYEQVAGRMVLCIPHGGDVLNFIIDNKMIVLLFVIAFNVFLYGMDKLVRTLAEE